MPAPHSPEDFSFLRTLAHYEGASRWCARQECRNRKRCCGGPRRIASTRGIPACRNGPQGEKWAAEKLAERDAIRQRSKAQRDEV